MGVAGATVSRWSWAMNFFCGISSPKGKIWGESGIDWGQKVISEHTDSVHWRIVWYFECTFCGTLERHFGNNAPIEYSQYTGFV